MSATVVEGSASQLEIPVIDISGFSVGDTQAIPRIASSIASAARSPGFFQITGHGISSSLISRLLGSIATFFALPKEVKESIHGSKSAAFRGFEAVGDQHLDGELIDCKEGFMVGPEKPSENARFLQGPNQWPGGSQGQDLKDVMMEYHSEMLRLSKVMLRLVALSLGLNEGYFDAFIGGEDSISMMRAHRYPPKTPETAENPQGVGAHTDFGALTLLLQDGVGGLEVFHKPSETWHAINPVEGALVVNIGDMLERWTNRHYTSTLHRVVSPAGKEYRYSVAFFNEGLLDQVIECIPTCLRPDEMPLYEPVKVEVLLRRQYGRSYS